MILFLKLLFALVVLGVCLDFGFTLGWVVCVFSLLVYDTWVYVALICTGYMVSARTVEFAVLLL